MSDQGDGSGLPKFYDQFLEIGEKKHLKPSDLCHEMEIRWEDRDEGFQVFCDFLFDRKLLGAFREFVKANGGV